MDAKDIRNLSEAYLEVYNNELDEGFKEFPSKKVYKQALKKPTGYEGDAQVDAMMNTRADFKNKTYDLAGKAKAKEAANRARGEAKRAAGKKKTFGNRLMRNEEQGYDIYDIILSHLLDEGYAETVEAAEVIMVNMSEEWRESICEELTGERRKRALEKAGGREALGRIPMPLAARVAVGREGQPLEVARKDPRSSVRTTTKGPTKRGGSGFKGRSKSDFQGTDDTVGSGNKAARRAGKKVRDTSDEV